MRPQNNSSSRNLALSNAVKDLENEMGSEIFIRNPKGITLTPDGMEFSLCPPGGGAD